MAPPSIVLSYPAIHPDDLVDHVEFLRECGYAFVAAGELVDRWPAGGEPETGLVSVCLEGGHRNELLVASPLLSVLGVPATHFIDPSRLGADKDSLSRADAEILAASGAELGVAANGVPLAGARTQVEQLAGRPCRVLAWPDRPEAGHTATAAAEAGFDAAFTATPGPWRRFAAPRLRVPARDGLVSLARWMERHQDRLRAAFVGVLFELDIFDVFDVVTNGAF